MLRSLVLILLILNLAFFSWTQGWLTAVVGVSPSAQHEPHRLNLQQHADQLEVIPPAGAASAALADAISAAASTDAEMSTSTDMGMASSDSAAATASGATSAMGTTCLRAGPFGTMEMSLVTTSIQPVVLPDQWRTEEVNIDGLWFVYMGPYPDREQFNRKQAELREIGGISFREVRTPTSLANGFVLGRYDQPQAAQAALDKLKERGIRSARVVIVRPRMQAQNVIVPQATASMKSGLESVRLPQGKRFTVCP